MNGSKFGDVFLFLERIAGPGDNTVHQTQKWFTTFNDYKNKNVNYILYIFVKKIYI